MSSTSSQPAVEDDDSDLEPPTLSSPVSEVDPEAAEQAVKAKDEANAKFKEKHYGDAIELYSKAISLNPNSAVYFSNRAFAYIKMELYGAAQQDATRAIELDPKYIKAYYRRANADFALGKPKLALKDFKMAARQAPNDPDLKKKLADCEKEVKRIRFEEALATPDEEVVLISSTIDLQDMDVEEAYTGPKMAGDSTEGYTITAEFVKAMLQEFKEQRLIHRRFAFEIIMQAMAIFKAQASVVDIPIPEGSHFTVCGDVHGQFYDVLNIWELNGLPGPENPYLFNGDFVDRGSFSLEIILSLFAYKVLCPTGMHLVRGNHESKNMNKMYGFDGEVKAKYNNIMVELFREAFNWLPLGSVLGGKVMVLHGGLFSRDNVTLDELRAIDRFREPPDEGLMCEMLWSDPSPIPGRTPSKRGVGVQFGPDVTENFLNKNGLELIIRSHEVKDEGYEMEHNGKLITLFSAPNYCDQMGNKGAFIRFNGDDMVPHFTTFSAVPHPNVKCMAYANSMMNSMW
eukprot:gene14048-19985_t